MNLNKESLKKLLFLFLSVIIIYFMVYSVSDNNAVAPVSNESEKIQVVFPKVTFLVETAKSPEKKSRGLMFRTSLPETEGMLFFYEKEGKHSFWMKNTLIPLDMIWISKDMTVVDVQTAVPCEENQCKSYVPKAGAMYVLEINAGLSEKNNILPGTSVAIR